MIYTGSITVSADTAEGSPQESSLKMTHGIIHNIKVTFPPGCVGLVGISFWVGGHPIAPITAQQWFVGDSRTIEFTEWHELKQLFNKITVKAYNTDDTYDHTVYYEFGVLKDWQITPWLSVNNLIKWIKVLLGKIDIQNNT